MTWHEDREISPGVPDLSYVLLGNDCETGWLELKASLSSSKSTTFKIEPSQHQWIGAHVGKIPIHFLVAWGDQWYFIDAKHHERLALSITKTELAAIAIRSFHEKSVAMNRDLFWFATNRGRNVRRVQNDETCDSDQELPRSFHGRGL
jgi:hypothetical protein